MPTCIAISKRTLDGEPEVKNQLKVLSQKIKEEEEIYVYLPHLTYLETFIWLLETNQIPFQLLES